MSTIAGSLERIGGLDQHQRRPMFTSRVGLKAWELPFKLLVLATEWSERSLPNGNRI